MEGLGAQPKAAGTRHGAEDGRSISPSAVRHASHSRLAQMFAHKSIRQSSSARELRQASLNDEYAYTGRTDSSLGGRDPGSATSTNASLSPSPMLYASPGWSDEPTGYAAKRYGLHSNVDHPATTSHAAMQSGTRRSLLESARQRDAKYHQFAAPSQTPSYKSDQQSSLQAGSSLQQKSQPQSPTAKPLVGLGLSGTDGRSAMDKGPDQSRNSALSYLQAGYSSSSPSTSTSAPFADAPVTSPSGSQARASNAQRSPVTMPTGLPSAYTHGGNQQQADWAYAPRSGALSENLPSMMRFDKDRDMAAAFSASQKQLPFRREVKPFGGSSAFAQQQQQRAGRQKQASPEQATRSLAPAPPSSIGRSGGIAMTTRTRSSSMIKSGSQSPSMAQAPLHTRKHSDGQPSLHHAGTSIYSSEDHGSSMMYATAGTHESASTSLTSLRDSYKGGDQAKSVSSLGSGGARQGRQSHARIPTPSRSTLASLAAQSERASEKGKGRQIDPPHSAQSFTTEERSALATPSDSPSDSHRRARLEPDSSATSSAVPTEAGHEQARDPHESYNQELRPGHLVPSGAFAQALSPIAGSSPGESLRSSVRNRQESGIFASSLQHSHDIPTLDLAKPLHNGGDQGDVNGGQQPTNPAAENPLTSGLDVLQQACEEEAAWALHARRRYLLLQQLHLDEIAAHAPENSGWLDAKNGCERVMLPKPSLRGRDSYHNRTTSGGRAMSESGHGSNMAAFERNRRQPASFSVVGSPVTDAARAQAMLSLTQEDQQQLRRRQSSINQPVFHHRMPPDVPSSVSPWTHPAELGERPEIPKRTSSREAYRRSNLRILTDAEAAAAAMQTPALTPNVMSDEDDQYDALTPDLNTVLAQGRALDEERKKWREEHQRSFGTNNYHVRRQRAKSSREQLPQQHRNQPSTDRDHYHNNRRSTLKEARSSPNLRQQARVASVQLPLAPPPIPDSPPLPRCFPQARNVYGAQGEKQARMRSKSMENLAKLRDSAIAFAAPCLTSSNVSVRDKKDKKESAADDWEEKNRRRSSASSRKRRSRAQTMSRYDADRNSKPLPSEERVTYDRPVVIGRELVDQGTSPGIGSGPHEIRHPSWEIRQSTSRPIDHYGAAISSPRPSLGPTSEVTSEITFSRAGRHATSRGYHRPTGSDELASMLRAQRRNEESSVRRPSAMRKPVVFSTDDEADEGEEEKKRWSLGMSKFIAETTGQESRESDATPRSTTASLPVPPRRTRSRLDNSSSMTPTTAKMHLSDSAEVEPTEGMRNGSSSMSRPSITADISDRSRADLRRANLTPLQQLQIESYGQPGLAFQTPPLHQPSNEEGFFTYDSAGPSQRLARPAQAPASATSDIIAQSPMQVAEQKTEIAREPAEGDRELLSVQERKGSVPSTLTAERHSSDDSASMSSRELWNTDVHNEEEFSSLFFRRPRPTGEVMAGAPSQHSSSSLHNDPQPRQDRDLAQFHSAESRTSAHVDDEVTPVESLRDPLDTTQSQRLAPPREGRPSWYEADSNGSHSGNESAWNDSSIGDPFSPRRRTLSIPNKSGDVNASWHDLPANARLGRVDSKRAERVEGGSAPPSISSRRSYGKEAAAAYEEIAEAIRTGANQSHQGESAEDDNADDDANSSRPTSEIVARTSDIGQYTRPRLQSFSASILLHPASVHSGDEEENEASPSQVPTDQRHVSSSPGPDASEFINFSSPAQPPPLQLPASDDDAVKRASSGTASHLALPRSTDRTSGQSQVESSASGGTSTSRREAIMDMVRSRVWPVPPSDAVESQSRPGVSKVGKGSDHSSGSGSSGKKKR